ncbi:MAG: phosphoglucosamine mutase [Actinomycetota bacterium]
MAERHLFGTDGVRGVANEDLTPAMSFDLARAAGEGHQGHVVIGRDTRRSGPMLTSSMMAGFNSVGIDTVDLGIIPVGAVSRLVRDTGATYGVMVSASHNPAPDNGIKFFGANGTKLSDADEAVIEARYFAGEPWHRGVGSKVGLQTVMGDAIERYIDKIVHPVEYSMRGLEFVVDTAHGAAFMAAPIMFDRVGATVEIINDAPDGLNINLRCGATHPERVAKSANGRVGLSFDGDADRLIAVDEDGVTADGDVIMAIFAQWAKERGKLKNDTVVATVMSNLGFRKAMERLGIKVVETAVGDRYVLEAMRETRAVVGGEQSGHVLLEDRATGDGLRTAIRLMEVMASTGKELRELRTVMKAYPQVLENVTVKDKAYADNGEIAAAISHGERALGSRGRLLVRPSGTESLIRVMVEAPTESEASDVAVMVAKTVEAELA